MARSVPTACLLLVVVLLAACSGDPSPAADPAATTTTAPTAEAPDDPSPAVPSALDDPDHPDFPEPLVPIDEIVSGGPPPDGIPPIDDPRFITVAEADDLLRDEEPVVFLDLDGEARAYPVRILIWHEIVNDTVAGIPVSVTYCPLCNSAITFVRRVDGVETTFGTSGRLYASALVMYDRLTESLWTHFDGRAVVGALTGTNLESLPSPLLSWAEFRQSFPDALVLDAAGTGFDRDYGANPYVGYDDPDTRPFLFLGDADARARAKQRVVGIAVGDDAAAWTLEAVSGGRARATNASVGGSPVVILWKAGQATALEDRRVALGRDVGSVGVFSPLVDGRVLEFAAVDGGFVDTETGSTWTITGSAVAGPLAGADLPAIGHLDTFWFAWATYRPGTVLIEE